MATATKSCNEQREKLFGLLCGAGYHLYWKQAIPNESTLECWSGKRGILMVQVWKNAGVDIYHAAGIPNDWDGVEAWLAE